MFTSSSTLTEQSARADGEEALMPAKRRTRIEPGIYTRPDGRYEIGWRGAEGRQRWRKVDGGITAARKALRAELTKRANAARRSLPIRAFASTPQPMHGGRPAPSSCGPQPRAPIAPV